MDVTGSFDAARDAQRSAAAERMRLSRERRRLGFFNIRVDVAEDQIDFLVQRAMLAEKDRSNPSAIASAVEQLVDIVITNAGRKDHG